MVVVLFVYYNISNFYIDFFFYFSTHPAFVGFFTRVNSHVNDQLVSCIERLSFPWAVLPLADVLFHGTLLDVTSLDMLHQFRDAAQLEHARPPLTRLRVTGFRLQLWMEPLLNFTGIGVIVKISSCSGRRLIVHYFWRRSQVEISLRCL